MDKKSENILIVFAKRPKRGETKTRIASETSNAFALEFTIASFSDLINKVRNSNYYDIVVATDTYEDIAWFEDNYNLPGFRISKKLKDKGITHKFEYIFETLLAKSEYKKAILIPMDIPFIKEEDIIASFARLNKNKYVLGPETNGGIYLIGINSPYKKNVFRDVPWSTSHSFKKLKDNMSKSGNSAFQLKYKTDLNTFNVVLKLRKDISMQCPNLYKLLKRNGYYLSLNERYVNYDVLNIRVPIVAGIVERKKDGSTSILIQTRYKPSIDSDHTGLIEIPGGLLEKSVSVKAMLKRELFEEAGVKIKIKNEESFEDKLCVLGSEKSSLAINPFCCTQQLEGKRLYLGLVYLCSFKEGELREKRGETKNPRWITINELENLVQKNPEKIFSPYLPVLKKYIEYKRNEVK